MPTILDAQGKEQQIDETTFRRMQRSVESGQAEWMASVIPSDKETTRLFDCIDQSWTQPFPTEMVYKHHLRKMVVKCSACYFTTVTDNGDRGVADHVRRTLEQAEMHEGVEVTPPMAVAGQEPSQICQGCGLSFSARKMGLKRHINSVIEMGLSHQNKVESLLMKRFMLEPSEPIVLRTELIQGDSVKAHKITGADVNQQERKRRRKRHRRNRGSNTTVRVG